jgi:predicted ester cyclase
MMMLLSFAMTAEAQTMSLDAEKDLSRRSLAMWQSTTTDNPDEVFASNYVNHQEPGAQGGVGSIDLDQWKSVVAQNHTAFPDLKLTVLMQIAEGDRVATHWQFSGTQTGEYLGQAATDKKASWAGVQIDRFENGKIIESWVTWDKYTLFSDLGMLK